MDTNKNDKIKDEEWTRFVEEQASKYFCHKLFLRIFLEENSNGKQGEFRLYFKGKDIVIEPEKQNGKTFKFRL